MGTKATRDAFARMSAIPPGAERIVLATGRYIGEGFDDARLDTLFLTLPVSWRGFKIDEVLHGAFGVHVGDPANARRVVVDFSAEKADLVAGRVWHPTQELKRITGGRTAELYLHKPEPSGLVDSSVGPAREGHRAG